ncbi:phage tail protein [Bradyrhizobium sp. URHD0069]|uniref:phage tail protein n=1 Tax=Bradyrhizobium sp. URHD0069 TaxID=1380355 RepID=UPI0018CC75B4|nr:phage tail protein [Bradyrhizobium sp. URHD0069]
MTVNVKTGTETQTPFASSITRYGSNATAYRSHICVEVINCPLSLFNNEIPFASIFVHEADSITRNDALAALARYARYDDSEFEFDVSGSDKFWIVGQNTQFIPFLAGLRSIFRHWNITATDKLRVIENSADDAISATIVRSNMLANDIELVWDSPLSITSDRALGFIDTGRDNDFNTATAQLERFPVPLTASQDSETIELPIGMTFAEASTLVNDSLQIDDIARKKMRFTAKMALYGMEPGDIFDFSDDPDISLTARIISIARRASDHAIEIEAERVDFSTFANVAPVITSNGGGSTASITINENTTAVTTVTATDANGDPLTYSISGGADAALFGIGASTGVLAFLVAPDYETPTDADSDNAYVVIVQVSDGSMTDTQTITVTVADVSEGGGTADDDFLLLIE